MKKCYGENLMFFASVTLGIIVLAIVKQLGGGLEMIISDHCFFWKRMCKEYIDVDFFGFLMLFVPRK